MASFSLGKLFGLSLLTLALAGCDDNANAAAPGLPKQLANGNFEQGSGLPSGWHLEDKVKGQGQITLAANRHGKALLLKPNDSNSGKDLLGLGQMLDASELRNQTIGVSALLGASGGATAIIGVHVLGDSAPFVQFRQGDNNGELSPQQDQLEVPDNAEHIIVYAITSGADGQAWFDNIQLTSITPKKLTAPPAQAARASIELEPKQSLRTVPSSLFGSNIEWINNGQGLWSTEHNRLHPEAMALSKEMGPTLLRFPGGVFSDYYNWRNGIGPRAQRPTSLHYPGGPKSANHFGSDEALDFANGIGADLLITVNAGHGTAQQAADWVKYLNRDKRAGIQWWEIGNELYMDGDLAKADLSASEYAQKYLSFAKAMRAADPTIKLGAIGGLNYGRYAFVKDGNWNKTVLSKTAREADFFAVHNAYAPVVIGAKENLDPSQVYAAMLAAPLNIEDNINDLDALLKKYEDPNNPIALAITEWGPMFHVLPSSPWVDHVKTLGSAVFVGSTLHSFMRQPRLQIANAFKLTDFGFMGWIGNKGADFRFAKTAPALAFELYTDAIGGNVIKASTRSPSYDSKSIGVVNSVKDVPYLDVVAVRKDQQLIIYVVNKYSQQAIETTVKINDLVPPSSGSVRAQISELSGAAIDAHTGTRLPDIPGLEWAQQVSHLRFNQGGEGELGVRNFDKDVEFSQQSFRYSFPAMSISRITFNQLSYR